MGHLRFGISPGDSAGQARVGPQHPGKGNASAKNTLRAFDGLKPMSGEAQDGIVLLI